MKRVKITFSYDGSEFNGFQIQKHEDRVQKSVAGYITKALRKLNIPSSLVGSGRTDKGVHALSQVAHFDLPTYWENIDKLQTKLTKMLLPHIYIKKLELVDDSFHARFSAKKRYYRYILYKGSYNPFFAKYALHVKSIDTQKLDKIIKHFIGSHNFEYFRKNGSENKSDVREIFDAGAYDYQNFTVVYFYGNSFLRSQVRMMCDFSLKVMQEKFSIKELQEQLERKQKHATSLSPASGLYLSKIYY